MLNLFRKDTLTPQTERIYKVPLCIQDTIPIYRIAENGIFELESPTNKDGGKKKLHQFDKMYLFEDINFSTQDEEEKEETGKRFETLLRSMNVSYKIIVSNHYADNGKLREEILQKAVSKEREPLAREYHQMIEDRLQEGRGGLLQSKYFIVTCRKPDYESAKSYFNASEWTSETRRKVIRELLQAGAEEDVIKSIIRPEIEEGQVLQKKGMWLEMQQCSCP